MITVTHTATHIVTVSHTQLHTWLRSHTHSHTQTYTHSHTEFHTHIPGLPRHTQSHTQSHCHTHGHTQSHTVTHRHPLLQWRSFLPKHNQLLQAPLGSLPPPHSGLTVGRGPPILPLASGKPRNQALALPRLWREVQSPRQQAGFGTPPLSPGTGGGWGGQSTDQNQNLKPMHAVLPGHLLTWKTGSAFLQGCWGGWR